MEKEKLYVLTETQLANLLISAFRLAALEYYGVDNWCGYGECFNEFLSDLPDCNQYTDLDEYAINQVSGYPQMIED